MKVKLWDEKAAVDAYIHKFDNLHRSPSECNKFLLSWPVLRPTVPHAYTYVREDYGLCVAAAIDRWEDLAWKEKLTQNPIPTCSCRAMGQEMYEKFKKLNGKDVEYEITAMPNEMLTQMMQIADDRLVFKDVDLSSTKSFVDLGVKFHAFEDYVEKELLPLMR
ncbi:hypothetical protein CALVIDRAFT_199956 [Calocera viscosa TUFC12733]|uniref:NmrA-like domain-containing protein n=1 Tax=Calocera viscosa (strain TUFC12733) TaxID=1330018 RepID=A0A167KL03_CALVF|nr:hypothetical protein CALVIDRAFT_199956 [Calocera viscosa TUFC12733]